MCLLHEAFYATASVALHPSLNSENLLGTFGLYLLIVGTGAIGTFVCRKALRQYIDRQDYLILPCQCWQAGGINE